MLTRDMIVRLLAELGHETVAEFDGHRVQKKTTGYSDDKEIGACQAALSIMLGLVTKGAK